MSTLKVSSVQHASAASPAITLDASGQATLNGLAFPTSGSLSGRNRIINGDMRIDQRNAGASVTTANAYTLDRWSIGETTAGACSISRSNVAPATYVNSLLWTTTIADSSLGAGEYAVAQQLIEGFNVADLAWGTASALPITLSFWVRSSLTGTFAGAFQNNGSARAYVFNYSIAAANTWEYKTITVPGDTSGTWLTDNGIGLRVAFSLGFASQYQTSANTWQSGNYWASAGETQVIGTLNATWQITGVQLEAGTVATPFERRSYGQELAFCQRYYEKSYNTDVVPGTSTKNGALGLPSQNLAGNNYALGTFSFNASKRASPTMSYWDLAGNASKFSYFNSNTATYTDNVTPAAAPTFHPGTSQCMVEHIHFNPNYGSMGIHWVAAIEL